MTSNEMIEKLRFYEEYCKSEDMPVVIRLAENSVGMTAHTDVQFVTSGIDWDSDAIWIEPAEPLLRKEKDRDRPLMAIRKTWEDPKLKRIIKCPKCEEHLRKADKYCSRCGQRILVGEYIEREER